MPITINQNKVKFKNPDGPGFIEFDTIAGETTQQLVAELQQRADDIRGTNWPAKAVEVNNSVQEITNKVNNLVKFQDTVPSTSSTTQVWVDTSNNIPQIGIPTYQEFTDLINITSNSLLTDIAFSWATENAYIKIADGKWATSPNWKRTDMIPIPENVKGLYYTCSVSEDTVQIQNVASVAFYTTNDASLSSSYIKNDSAGIKFGQKKGLSYTYLPIPTTAKYMRLSVLANFVESYVIKYVININEKIEELIDLNSTNSLSISQGDLNNYKTIGSYSVANGIIAKNITNYPCKVGGRIIIGQTSNAFSIIQIVISNAGDITWRVYANEIWTDWMPKTNKVTTITCGENKDYNTLVECLDYVTSDALRNTWDENNRLVIKLDAGTFSMNAIADLYNQDSTRYKWGLYIPRYCTIQGAGKDKTFVTYDYSGTDDWILGHLAPFNMPYESEMRDLTITAKNCRYCVHSDGDEPFGRTWARNNNKIHVENVKMIHQGYSSGNNPTYNTPSAWGSGIRSGVTREFVNCEFIAYHMPWFCHNTIGQDAPSYIVFNNCKFVNKKTSANLSNIGQYESAAFISWGTNVKTYIEMKNCYLNRCAYIRNTTTYNSDTTCDYYLDSDGFEFVAESGTNNAYLLDTWCNRNCVIAVADQAVTGYKPVTVTVNGSVVAYSAGAYQHGIAINSCDADGTAVVQIKGLVSLPRLGISGRSVGDLLGYSGGAWVVDSSNPIIKVLDAYIGEIV